MRLEPSLRIRRLFHWSQRTFPKKYPRTSTSSDIASDIEAENAARERKRGKADEKARKVEVIQPIGLNRFQPDFIEVFKIGLKDSHPLRQFTSLLQVLRR